MALHVLGLSDAQASIRVFMHQFRLGLPLNKEIGSHHIVDGLNELQIRERDHLSNDDLVGQLRVIGPKAVKGRWGTPAPMRYLPFPIGPPIGWVPQGDSASMRGARLQAQPRTDPCALSRQRDPHS